MLQKLNKSARVSYQVANPGFMSHRIPAFGQDSLGTAKAGVTTSVTSDFPREKAEDKATVS